MNRSAAIIAALAALCLTACGSASADGAVDGKKIAVQADAVLTDEEELTPDRPIAKPDVTLVDSKTLSIASSLENVDSIRIYSCEVSSKSGGTVTQSLILDGTVGHIDSGKMAFNTDNIIETETYEKDNSAIKTGYDVKGIRVCFSNDRHEEWSELMALKVYLDTGVADQHDLEFHGATACGAANGALVLQTALPVWGDELTERMSEVRDYSALGYDYSEMEDNGYRMTGEMVLNSVNKYLEDKGVGGYELTDIGANDRPTAELVIEAIDSGRPAEVLVAYYSGKIVTEFQGYGHWITVSGYRVDHYGLVWFRWENTLKSEQQWVEASKLEKAVQAFIDGEKGSGAKQRTLFTTDDGVDITTTRHVLVLSEPPVDSFV